MNTGKEKLTRAGYGKEETTVIRVECYIGHRAEESPSRFIFYGKREIEVSEIIDQLAGTRRRLFEGGS
jgi:hypothetical protein